MQLLICNLELGNNSLIFGSSCWFVLKTSRTSDDEDVVDVNIPRDNGFSISKGSAAKES